MNESLLFYFAFPIAAVIFSSISTEFLPNPFKISLIVFGTFLVVTFSAYDAEFLVFTIAYTILSYITAWITLRIMRQINGINNIERIATNNNAMLNDSISIVGNISDIESSNQECLYNNSRNYRNYKKY